MDTKLKLESVVCLVCQEILIKPIKLPCSHLVCLECLEKIVENSNLTCPMCRRRLSHFLRKNKDYSLLVDKILWKKIQIHFKTEVEQKLAGYDDGAWDSVILETTPVPARQMYTPGELKAEYTRLQAQALAEREQQAREEQAKSLALIRQLQMEEEQRRAEEEKQRLLLEKQDEEYAKSLLELEQQETGIALVESPPTTRSQIKTRHSLPASNRSKIVSTRKSTSSADGSRISSGSSSKGTTGPIDMFCIRTTSPSMFAQTPLRRNHQLKSKSAQKRKSTIEGPLDRFYVRESSATKRRCTTSPSLSSRSSSDSIDCEMNYFKPIKLVPRTPPKSDTEKKPIVVFPKLAKAISSDLCYDCSPKIFTSHVHLEGLKNSLDGGDVEMTSVSTNHADASLSVTNSNPDNPERSASCNANTIITSPTNASPPRTNSYQTTPLKTFAGESKLVFNSPSHWSRSLFGGSQTKCADSGEASAIDNSDSVNNNLDTTICRTPKKGCPPTSSFDTRLSTQDGCPQKTEIKPRRSSQSEPSTQLNHMFANTPKRSSKLNHEANHFPSPGKASSDNFPDKTAPETISASFTPSVHGDTTESLRNKREIEHFFAEFKKISLHQAEGSEEACFSQLLKTRGVSSGRSQRSCFIQSDDETDLESDFFPSPLKSTVVK